MKIALLCLLISGCAPWNVDAVPPSKKCQIWVQIDGKGWHCYERGEVLRELRRAVPNDI